MNANPLVFEQIDGTVVINWYKLVQDKPVNFEANAQQYFVMRREGNVLEIYQKMKAWEVVVTKISSWIKQIVDQVLSFKTTKNLGGE